MIRFSKLVLLSVLVAMVGMSGCSSQADPGYQGELLATIRGDVKSQRTQDPGEVEAVVVWHNFISSGDLFLGEKVQVSGVFPAAFHLDLYHPPVTEALNDFTVNGSHPGESKIGVALILAVKAGANIQDLQSSDVLGASEEHVLVWVEEDVQPGSMSELFLHEPLKGGYHLMRVEASEEGFDQLHPVDDDTPVTILLVDDIETLDLPNFT